MANDVISNQNLKGNYVVQRDSYSHSSPGRRLQL